MDGPLPHHLAHPSPPRLQGHAAEQALHELLAHRPLLAFDFDGTLAPIVPRPEGARPPPVVVERLARLVRRVPVAVISGRALDDLLPRLGFKPTWAVGSHGAEDPFDAPGTAARGQALDVVRERLRQHAAALDDAHVMVEDKRASIALHHRLAPDHVRAEAVIAAALQLDDGAGGFEVFGGKRVVNVVAAGSPDKAGALLALAERSRAGNVLYAGDDVNDEPAFRAARPHWLTVRVGRDAAPTAARWRVDGVGELAALLHRLAVLCDRLSPDL